MRKTYTEKRKTFDKIISLVIENSQEGLNQFYKEYGRFIYMTAKSVGCDGLQAESVVNKVLVKIWRKAKDLFNIENPEGWIYTVAKNCAKDEINRIWDLELNENICKTEDEFEKIHSEDSFQYLISFLKGYEREIISLKFSKDLTFQDIADCLKKPLPTITSKYYRALEKIKNSIKDKEIE